MSLKYHCFWVNPYGMERRYEVHGEQAPVLDLVKRAADPDGDVRGLKVVFGTLLEFEPAVVVQTYRVKAEGVDEVGEQGIAS